MGFTRSPLRYPGGKSNYGKLLAEYISANNLLDGIYAEPYAGGAGAALFLLFSEYVSEIHLNDADPRIYHFWDSILNNTEELLRLIRDTPVSIDQWRIQKQIVTNITQYSGLEIAFATFFLNRCNRSGILGGGPIGGFSQKGDWKLDVRFNKENLIQRIEKIALFQSRIKAYNIDAIDFLDQNIVPISANQDVLVYLDPPYYSMGDQLYFNHYTHTDHERLSLFLHMDLDFHWILTYDAVAQIEQIYTGLPRRNCDLYYSLQKKRRGSEIILFKPGSIIPNPVKGDIHFTTTPTA